MFYYILLYLAIYTENIELGNYNCTNLIVADYTCSYIDSYIERTKERQKFLGLAGKPIIVEALYALPTEENNSVVIANRLDMQGRSVIAETLFLSTRLMSFRQR